MGEMMGEDNKFLDLRGLVASPTSEHKIPIKHDVALSYGEHEKIVVQPDEHTRPYAGSFTEAVSSISQNHDSRRSQTQVTRRAMMKGVGAAAIAAYATGTRIIDENAPLNRGELMMLASEKALRDLKHYAHPLLSHGKLPQVAHPDGRQVPVDAKSAWAIYYPLSTLNWFDFTGNPEFLDHASMMLCKMDVGKINPIDPTYEDINNPAVARLRVARPIRERVNTHTIARRFSSADQDDVERVAREARAAEIMVARMADKDVGAFYGLIPQAKNRILTIDHPYFLVPLLHDAIRNGIEGVLDPRCEIKRPQNELEAKIIDAPALSFKDICDIAVKGALLYAEAHSTPDGKTNYFAEATVQGGRWVISGRNPRHTHDKGYGTADPAVVTPDHIEALQFMDSYRMLFKDLLSMSPADSSQIQGTDRLLHDRIQAGLNLVSAGLREEYAIGDVFDSGMNRRFIGNVIHLMDRSSNRGILGEHLYLPGASLLAFDNLDIGSTAAAIPLLRKYGREDDAALAEEQIFSIVSDRLSLSSGTIGTPPPMSRGWFPQWTTVWTAPSELAIQELFRYRRA